MAWIGTSGWSYDHWDDVLYHGARPADRLGIYTSEFATVELNASFYRWPRDASFASWQRRLPEGFRMTVKAPRALTHARKLYAYFNNDGGGNAVRNARTLRAMLG